MWNGVATWSPRPPQTWPNSFGINQPWRQHKLPVLYSTSSDLYTGSALLLQQQQLTHPLSSSGAPSISPFPRSNNLLFLTRSIHLPSDCFNPTSPFCSLSVSSRRIHPSCLLPPNCSLPFYHSRNPLPLLRSVSFSLLIGSQEEVKLKLGRHAIIIYYCAHFNGWVATHIHKYILSRKPVKLSSAFHHPPFSVSVCVCVYSVCIDKRMSHWSHVSNRTERAGKRVSEPPTLYTFYKLVCMCVHVCFRFCGWDYRTVWGSHKAPPPSRQKKTSS